MHLHCKKVFEVEVLEESENTSLATGIWEFPSYIIEDAFKKIPVADGDSQNYSKVTVIYSINFLVLLVLQQVHINLT